MLMHIYVASGKDREEGLADSLAPGLLAHRDHIKVSPVDQFIEPDVDANIGAVFGLKGHSRRVMDAYRVAGKHTIMFDKALIRVQGGSAKNLRVCIDADTPLKYLMRVPRSFERWERAGIDLKPKVARVDGRAPIILALSSQKYCTYHGLGDATQYATSLVEQIRQNSRKRPIIYRPKPSWPDFVAIPGTFLSRPPEYLPSLLGNAHVLVTHGSSAAIDAMLSGVPTVTLGECAARPISNHAISDIPHPWFPSYQARWQFMCNLAWAEWSVPELQSGEAWGFIRGEIEALERR
jgi:hypothetical protein